MRLLAAGERIEHEIAGIGRGEQAAFEQDERLLRRMFAVGFFRRCRSLEPPDGFHLLAGISFAHLRVVECVPARFVLRGPQDRLGRMREVAAGKIRRRVWFFPSDVVQDFEAELLEREADAENHMLSPADPDRAVWLQRTLAASQPSEVELVIEFRAARLVPAAPCPLLPCARCGR